ncbi:ABC transporter permease subunit [Prochlorococcus sp. MIT 1300]|uniref:ABC transporter permease subunit n=1 Tax=Prochlorococcus sp. MIT 1300 TaxID=3096218 RepID=UPI002A765F0A|nr:ABC transporter permease subunit [Prochlorococcus sp. MIT 1300]
MKLSNSILIQFVFGIFLFSLLGILINNLIVNLIVTDMGISFNWLGTTAGFALSESSLPYEASDTYLWALINGLVNSLKVIFAGLCISTIIGIFAGVARLSGNLLLRHVSNLYVLLIRQIPLLIQLLFWYFVAILGLSETPIEILAGGLKLSNQGLSLFGVTVSAEFSSILIGLSIFTGAYIAEVVRGGLNSVDKGQWEAFKSLGLSQSIGLRKIIIPQALPAIIPGLTSQYLNLAKNSTLAIAVGYADIYAVSDTTITQTGRAIEGFAMLLCTFLIINLLITRAMNFVNNLCIKINTK